MIGNHPSMHQVFDMIQRIAATDSTVLIQGESGTGKEMVARGIHFRSHRRSRAFVPVNCSAFTDSLLESELFGHRKGAFTGAVADKDGLFQVAEGGTIFLDEVGDMSLSTQVKLLRVLEERKVSSVGSTELTPVDVRIVAATNKVMEDEVRAQHFREDLFYRLNVIPMWLPPLRERKEDIPLLVGHFLAKYSLRMRKEVVRIADEALRRLCDHDWPGNVRELENIIQRHVAFCDGEKIEHIEIGSCGPPRRPPGHGLERAGAASTASTAPTTSPTAVTDAAPLIPEGGMELEAELQAIERRYLCEALRMTGGHMTRAAKLLGMSYRSIRYRVKKLGIKDEVHV
jgi:two-component system response regulator PilR (NtrC family)